jgi:hypothetical protein
MKPFNLTDALAGAPLQLANGTVVTEFKALSENASPYKYTALVGGYCWFRYTDTGLWNAAPGGHEYYNLHMVEDIIDESI